MAEACPAGRRETGRAPGGRGVVIRPERAGIRITFPAREPGEL
jgi:hypothetical protein